MPEITAGPASGYLAVAAGSQGSWPGVVVIHESWGLNGDSRAHADRLAAKGYLALAPDLYPGRGPSPIPASRKQPVQAIFPVGGPDVGVMDHYGLWNLMRRRTTDGPPDNRHHRRA